MQTPEPTTLLSLFRQLRTISEALRAAMVANDADGILRAVQEQEQIVQSCRDLRSTRPAAARTDAHDTPPATARELRTLVADIQRLQHTNHRVAAAFLETVDRTLTSLGVGAPRRRVTYGVDGWNRAPSTPVLFQQRG